MKIYLFIYLFICKYLLFKDKFVTNFFFNLNHGENKNKFKKITQNFS